MKIIKNSFRNKLRQFNKVLDEPISLEMFSIPYIRDYVSDIILVVDL